MESTTKVLVMYSTDYSIKDDETGRTNEGCTIQYYFFGERGEALNSVSGSESGSLGFQRGKCSTDKLLRQKIKFLPAICDATFTMSIGSDGKAVQKIVDLNNFKACDFTKLFMSEAAATEAKKAANANAAAK